MSHEHFMDSCKVCKRVVKQCRCLDKNKAEWEVICPECAGKAPKVVALGDTAKARLVGTVVSDYDDDVPYYTRDEALRDLEELRAVLAKAEANIAALLEALDLIMAGGTDARTPEEIYREAIAKVKP